MEIEATRDYEKSSASRFLRLFISPTDATNFWKDCDKMTKILYAQMKYWNEKFQNTQNWDIIKLFLCLKLISSNFNCALLSVLIYYFKK